MTFAPSDPLWIGKQYGWAARVFAWRLAVLLLAVVASSCGYSLAGRGSFLPAYVKTIGVPVFVNRTVIFNVEQLLTDKVRIEFIGRGKYKVLPEAAGADASLIGEITSVTVTPASFTPDQQASRYLITMSASIELKDLHDGSTIWQNPGLVIRAEYEATSGRNALDPVAFFGQEANALDRVSNDFARTIVSAILEAF